MKTSTMSTPASGLEAASAIDLVSRLTTVMKKAQLDCDCRSQLDEALDRFAAMERKRMMRGHLADACKQSRKIEAILPFLRELDELTPAERDRSVYLEMALLFDDIANAAVAGAAAMRSLNSASDA